MRAIAVVAALAVSAVARGDEMKAFPPAEPGQVRWVVRLPQAGDESSLKVEIIAGRTVRVDDRNRYVFGGVIRAEDIAGWGYTRYVVDPPGPMIGTHVAVPPDAPKVERFVPLAGEPYLVRYDGRLPLVVYAPEGVEVRHRVWTAAPKARPFTIRDMRGTFRYMADAARFEECGTGRSWPVAMEGDYRALEKAYLAAEKPEPGAPLLATFDGEILARPAMEGNAKIPTVVVRRFAGLGPGASCALLGR